MSNFNTDDDFEYPSNDYPSYGSGSPYDHPEYGGASGYGKMNKNPFSKLSALFQGFGSGLTLEKILIVIYIVALVIIVFHLSVVLDFLFYTTMAILQHIIVVAVIVLMGYCIFKFIR